MAEFEEFEYYERMEILWEIMEKDVVLHNVNLITLRHISIAGF